MTAALETELVQWIAAVTGQAPPQLQAIPGGGSRSSYIASLQDGSRYLLRVDNGQGPLSGTSFTIEREYRVLTALHQAGLAVPGIRAFNGELNAMLMEFIDGRTHYQVQLDEAQQRVIQRNLMAQLSLLHGFDLHRLGLTEFAALRAVREAIGRDLDTLEDMYTRLVTLKEPTIEFALHWLRANIPEPDRRAALVHGDIGPGNFLFGTDGQVLALIDWEVTHMGHPLEDLAAVLCRAIGAPFGAAAEHIANYAEFSRHPVDLRMLDYFVILVLTRWYVGLNLALSRPALTQNIPVLTTYRQSVVHTLLCVLARQYGITSTVQRSTATATTETAYLTTYLAGTLTTSVLPALQDPFVADRARGLGKIALYLQELLAYGPERLQREEQADIETLTGERYADVATARTALGRLATQIDTQRAASLVLVLLRTSTRQHLLWTPAMGDMAHRSIGY